MSPFLATPWPGCGPSNRGRCRLGIATGQGHAAMIYKRFGKWWGVFSLVDLLLVNFLTLVTEFAAIALAAATMGITP
ncbi:MAG: divalent metal cation transporter, partial [Armatimonadota bacterium]